MVEKVIPGHSKERRPNVESVNVHLGGALWQRSRIEGDPTVLRSLTLTTGFPVQHAHRTSRREMEKTLARDFRISQRP